MNMTVVSANEFFTILTGGINFYDRNYYKLLSHKAVY